MFDFHDFACFRLLVVLRFDFGGLIDCGLVFLWVIVCVGLRFAGFSACWVGLICLWLVFLLYFGLWFDLLFVLLCRYFAYCG